MLYCICLVDVVLPILDDHKPVSSICSIKSLFYYCILHIRYNKESKISDVT